MSLTMQGAVQVADELVGLLAPSPVDGLATERGRDLADVRVPVGPDQLDLPSEPVDLALQVLDLDLGAGLLPDEGGHALLLEPEFRPGGVEQVDGDLALLVAQGQGLAELVGGVVVVHWGHFLLWRVGSSGGLDLVVEAALLATWVVSR
ncbi:hypothetical protein G5V59_10040 [Nocardioides sp. W3-2-3]|uniref:hypothetical protein n=1 Tax=Nocardioides convexus TaxID=2712224 RepID=UPI0024182F94|nr:hypothetical protein [Nocardioides convexus]NHA00336.1 hypothetical protein [Nocardioides convexus]